MSGPAPKPTHIKELEGVREDRINRSEPKPDPLTPICPEWITGAAKVEYERLAPELERLGLLTIADKDAFETYCWLQAKCVELAKDIDKKGMIHITPNKHEQPRAEVSMLREMLKLKKSLGVEFGLTPSSRSRLSVQPQDEEDSFGDMLD